MGILSESQSLSQVTVQISVDCIWSHLNASVAACPCVKLGLTWFLLGLTIHACESSSLHMSCVIGVVIAVVLLQPVHQDCMGLQTARNQP